MKLCECGCGEPAPLAKRTNARLGLVTGQPQRYVRGHRNQPGAKATYWRGGRKLHAAGYVLLFAPLHGRAKGRYVFEHVMIAERVLGHPLPPQAVVHHVNKDRADNQHHNLVICENTAYHMLLHIRQRAIEAGCPPTWMKCCWCKQYDHPDNLFFTKYRRVRQYHRACHSQYKHDLKHRR